MSKTLDVYLCDDLVGRLLQDDHGDLAFRYADSWLESAAAIPLSQSLPLEEKSFRRKQCRGFFAGVLPEQSMREIIARNLGISAKNDFKMLEQIGGECAGAVTFMPAGKPLPKQEHDYRKLSNEELSGILKELPRRPLLAGDKNIRLSLAGAQEKIPVHVFEGQISLPLSGAPSTHILKPANERFEGLVFNEAFCMKLAAMVGLPVAKTEIGSIYGLEYLLVERYDRKTALRVHPPRAWPYTERLHQEDFCQALGIVPELKYQNEGGPSLKQCFDLLREASDVPAVDILALLNAVIFNFLIGNHDAHSKNFSLLYSGETAVGRETRLAPFYDLVSTVYYPELTTKMAMKIGGEYMSGNILPKHFERLAEEAGLGKPSVRQRVPALARAILDHLDNVKIDHKVAHEVAALIRERCKRAILKFETIKTTRHF
ncbi:MAG: type II toxin-antitoxin system HipA family toxin [Syntrophobacteraceae bacterium]